MTGDMSDMGGLDMAYHVQLGLAYVLGIMGILLAVACFG